MLRRLFLVMPGLAIVSALVALQAADRPVAVVLGVAVVALAVTLWLARTEDRRLDHLAARVTAFSRMGAFSTGQPPTAMERRGGAAWRRLVDALNAVAGSLQQRFDDLAGERARIERILDDLPLAVLLFTQDGLAYANPAARVLFLSLIH